MATPMTQPIRPQTGHPSYTGELWTAGPNGELRKDITGSTVSCRVRWNWSDAIPGTIQAVVRGRDISEAIKDCLVPFLTVSWDDRYGNRYSVRERLGLFFYLPPDRDYGRVGQENMISGMDTTWALSQLRLGRQFILHPGSAYLGIWAREMFLSGGNVELQYDFPQTSVRPVKLTTYRPNDNVLEKMNELYARGGYWPIVSDRRGVIRTAPRLLTTGQDVAREIRSLKGDVLISGAIRSRPDREAFYNEVYLSSNNPQDGSKMLKGFRATLTDPNSPYSRDRLGWVRSFELADDTSETFEVMQTKAVSMLENVSSMLERKTIAVIPDPRFEPREVWDVEIEQDDGNQIATGKWRVEGVTFGFEEGGVAAQTVDIAQVAQIESID